MKNCPVCGGFLSNQFDHFCEPTLVPEPKVKHPLGVIPNRIWKFQRMGEIGYAIMNRIDAQLDVPFEWVTEYNALQKELNGNGNE